MPPKKVKTVRKVDKKQKDKGGERAEAKGPMFTEVERTFLELELAEANRKVARLRTAVDDHETVNKEVKKAYDQLDEDRADIIAYLKKVLYNRNEEIKELKDTVKDLEETIENERAQFKTSTQEMEINFKVMKDQLTSEAKLLTSKLNTMEEFRVNRSILMNNFEKQENQLKDQEMTYKRKIYDIEKKFVIGKDNLRKEMENRLMQLAQDFQDNTGLRIAATTHRVIRENIAINNELEKILASQAKLVSLNENYKQREAAAKLAKELAEEERDQTIKKNIAQLKLIDKLTTITQNVKKDKSLMEVQNDNIDNLKATIQQLTKDHEHLTFKVRVLEQNLHGKMDAENKSRLYISKIAIENKKMKNILKDAVITIQSALRLDQWAVDHPERKPMDREQLLLRLLQIMTHYRDTMRAESLDTLVSFGKVYEKGDLGFIPKVTSHKSAQSIVPSELMSNDSSGSFKCSSESSSSTSLGSIKTIPSVQIVPLSTEPKQPGKASLLSFVTSTKSTASDSDGESKEDDSDGMDKLLEQSKLEVQRAILKDLFAQQRPKTLVEESVHEEETRNSIDGGLVGDAEDEPKMGQMGGETVEVTGEGQETAEGDKTKEEAVEDEETKLEIILSEEVVNENDNEEKVERDFVLNNVL